MTTTKLESVEVQIDGGLDELSRGIGHTDDGDEAWVTGALPGERVCVSVSHVSKIGRVFGVSKEVLLASDDRVPVPCAHFLDCGGCDFLHANLESQHLFKHEAVSSALGLKSEDVEAVVPSPQATEYRALAKFVVGENGELGSYRPRSHEIVDMAGCVVHAPSIEKVASIVRENYSPNLELRYVIVRASLQQSLVIVTLIVRRDVGQSLNKLVDRLTELSEVAQIVMSVNDSDGDALIVPGDDVILYDGPSVAEQLGGAEQKLNSGAFSQINPGAAVGLYEQVVKCVDVQGKKFLDLYSGSGGISRALMLAGAASVHGVETNAQAVAAAKESSSTEDLSFEAASVEDVLDRLGDYDIIVVNPPRKGLSMAVVEALIELPKIDLVYVSCNPKSLARDVKLIEDNTEALIKRVVPVDMFPQTRHVETVLHLKS